MTPVKVEYLEELLKQTGYPDDKTDYLVRSFREGFDLGYRGDPKVKLTSPNLKFVVGDEVELWNKVMKEVELKRYAGPFKQIPFNDSFIQSPIGLVPKDGGTKTRLIFHLSYPKKKKFKNEQGIWETTSSPSVNSNTPECLTKVSYPDFDEAVKLCLKAGKNCHAGKSDLSSAFRHLCIARRFWRYLVMKAKNPLDKKWYFFFDKCLPFGASISCAHFQAFSNALAFITFKLAGGQLNNVNYLDDFFFVALLKAVCNRQLKVFIETCNKIRFPVSMEKTHWATTLISFLGLLIDTKNQVVSLPVDKVLTGKALVQKILSRPSKKTTLGELQRLTGFLNFLSKAVVPGRTFTRRLYAYTENSNLLEHHHINVCREMRLDLELWLGFLSTPGAFARPFFHFHNKGDDYQVLDWYTDSSRNKYLGCGGYCDKEWFIQQWDDEFIDEHNPSINYLELYAVTVGIFCWAEKYQNKKIILFCDNMSVVYMLNNATSKCRNCMVLIRLIVMKSLRWNVHISARHVTSEKNGYADHLSRMRYSAFRRLAKLEGKSFNKYNVQVPDELWPMNKLWLDLESTKKKKTPKTQGNPKFC